MMKSLLGYKGSYRDSVYGGYALGNGYRSYLPQLMIFIAPDSLSPFGRGGINPYRYCSNDPINRTDPSGHMDIPVLDSLYQEAISRAEGDASRDAQSITVVHAEAASSSAANPSQPVFNAPRPMHRLDVNRKMRSNPMQWGPAASESRSLRLGADPWSRAMRRIDGLDQRVTQLETATKHFYTGLSESRIDITDEGMLQRYDWLRTQVGQARRSLIDFVENWTKIVKRHPGMEMPYVDETAALRRRLLDINNDLDTIQHYYVDDGSSDEGEFESESGSDMDETAA